jgi:hypothetical protein
VHLGLDAAEPRQVAVRDVQDPHRLCSTAGPYDPDPRPAKTDSSADRHGAAPDPPVTNGTIPG